MPVSKGTFRIRKRLLLFSLFLIGTFGVFGQTTLKDLFPVDSLTYFPAKLEADSGVFNRDKAFDCLRKLITDTSEVRFPTYAEKDETWGKYYFVPATGNYIVCIMTELESVDFEFHLLIEVQNDGHIQTIEPYFHGNYSCCWTNFDGFFRFGNGLAFRYCGTGSGLCSAQRYLFDKVWPQDSLTALEDFTFFTYEGDEYSKIRSEWRMDHDSVSINYEFVFGKMKWIEARDEFRFKPKKKKQESYTFPLVNGVISIPDNMKIPEGIF